MAGATLQGRQPCALVLSDTCFGRVPNTFMVKNYYKRILELYFTLRKQRQHNLPELKTRFKISTGSGESFFKIDSHLCFEVTCGTEIVYRTSYDAPVPMALRTLSNVHTLIQARDMGDQVARALYFSRLSGPSRTSADKYENILLVNPELYAEFRQLLADKCLAGNADVSDITLDYYLS